MRSLSDSLQYWLKETVLPERRFAIMIILPNDRAEIVDHKLERKPFINRPMAEEWLKQRNYVEFETLLELGEIGPIGPLPTSEMLVGVRDVWFDHYEG